MCSARGRQAGKPALHAGTKAANKKPGAISPGFDFKFGCSPYRRDMNNRKTYQSISATDENNWRAAAT